VNTQLASRIRYARKRLKLTQTDIGDALGITMQSVAQWESGRASPSSSNLRRLADLLGVSLEWLGSDKSRLEDLDAPAKPLAFSVNLSEAEAELLRFYRRCSPEFRSALLAAARALAAQSSRKKSAS